MIRNHEMGESSFRGSNPLFAANMNKIEYVCDNQRHLICLPYSKENLHKMAENLGIKRCWFHKNHYDIPKKRIEEITKKCRIVTGREVVKIIKEECDNWQSACFEHRWPSWAWGFESLLLRQF